MSQMQAKTLLETVAVELEVSGSDPVAVSSFFISQGEPNSSDASRLRSEYTRSVNSVRKHVNKNILLDEDDGWL